MNIDQFKDIDPEFEKSIIEALPQSAKEFIDLIGLQKTLLMVMELGGTEFIFPKTRESKYFDVLAAVVGEEDAIRLGGEYFIERMIYIPMCVRAKALIRNRLIIKECEALCSAGRTMRSISNELSRKYGINYRQIEKIVNK